MAEVGNEEVLSCPEAGIALCAAQCRVRSAPRHRAPWIYAYVSKNAIIEKT